MAAPNAAIQAELMEKEKHIYEQQAKVENLKSKLVNLANHQKALDMERRRCLITQHELTTVTADRPVYKSLGRLFVLTTVDQLNTDYNARKDMCVSEAAKISEETRRLGTTVETEETTLKAQVADYVNQARILQAQQA